MILAKFGCSTVPWGVFLQKCLISSVFKLHSGRFDPKIVQKRENLTKILVKSPTVHTKIPKIGPFFHYLFATLTKTLGYPKKKRKRFNLGQILTIHSTVGSFPSKMLENLRFSRKKSSILAKFRRRTVPWEVFCQKRLKSRKN